MSHSLSWYRKGDRYPGSKLYARTWTPDDPNGATNQPPIQPLYTNNAAKSSGCSSNNSNSSQNHNSNQSSEDFNAGANLSDAAAAAAAAAPSIFGSGGGL